MILNQIFHALQFIALRTFTKSDDITNDAFLLNLANDDHNTKPKSTSSRQDIVKQLRMFLLSLTDDRARAIPDS